MIFIDDGFTFEATITDRDYERFPDIRIEYRPPLAAELYRHWYDRDRAKSGDDQLRLDLKLIETHLISWSAHPDPSPEALKRLSPFVITALIEAIVTYAKDQEDSEKNLPSATA